MKYLLLLLILFLAFGCQKKAKDAKEDLLSGAWYLGSRSGCMEAEQGRSKRQLIVISREGESFYNYNYQYLLYSDAFCAKPLLKAQYQGALKIAEESEVEDSKPPRRAFNIYLNKDNFRVTLVSGLAVTLANLMDGMQGLQKTPNQRFCQYSKDWLLGTVVDITGKTCSLGVESAKLSKALIMMQVEKGSRKMFWSDLETASSYFPTIVREDPSLSWYQGG